MAFINTPNVVRTALRFTLDGQDIVNTLWFRNVTDSLDDGVVLANFGNSLATWWEGNMAQWVADDLVLRDVTVTSQESLDAPSVVSPQTIPGEDISPPEPNMVAFVLKFNTAQRGRSGRGRNYIAGIPGNVVASNAVTSTFADGVRSAYNALIGSPIGNWEWVVVSFQLDNVERAQGYAQEVLAASYTTLNVRTQRRRNVGVGE